MENKTRFDLNAAVAKWRQELDAQPHLAPDDRRELEAHLRDAIADFQQRGLNDEECFWLARRRAGHPQELDQEFVKGNPAGLYRERIFWLPFGLLLYHLWLMLSSGFILAAYQRINLTRGHFRDLFPGWVSFYLPNWLCDLPSLPVLNYFFDGINVLLMLAALFYLVRQFEKLRPLVAFLFNNRARFILIAILSVIVISMAGNLIWDSLSGEQVQGEHLAYYLYGDFWCCCLIALVAWLMPVQNRRVSQLA